MDDIAELFASLAAAQTQQVAQRLMERNIVDLVQKLRDQGLQLYPTKDGKEYVTPDQVEREIMDAIAAHGGRMQARPPPPLPAATFCNCLAGSVAGRRAEHVAGRDRLHTRAAAGAQQGRHARAGGRRHYQPVPR